MENYQMSRAGCRPYNRTCGMMNPMPVYENMARAARQERACCQPPKEDCSCKMPGIKSKNEEMYTHLEHLEPAMAYVPCQKFTTTFDMGHGLRMGTIFPELCRPFCGKRGGRR